MIQEKKRNYWYGRKRPASFGAAISSRQKGRKIKSSTRLKMGRKDAQHHMWKGEKVGYRALHRWIEKKLGKPRHCAICQSTDRKPRDYHWANISKTYLRELSDWIRLCATCHGKFDCGKISI